MIQKTKDYEMFKFRDDNRPLSQPHLKALIDSIKSKNLLEMRPIQVNAQFEVIDGQHRIAAAKALGVDIYYQVEESLNPEDIIRLNIKNY